MLIFISKQATIIFLFLPAGEHEAIQQEQAGFLQHLDKPLLLCGRNGLWCRHNHLLWHGPQSQHGRTHSGVVRQNRTLQGYTHIQVILPWLQTFGLLIFKSSFCKLSDVWWGNPYCVSPRLESGNSIEEKLLKNGTKDLIREVAAQGTDYTLAFLTQVRWIHLSSVCKPAFLLLICASPDTMCSSSAVNSFPHLQPRQITKR